MKTSKKKRKKLNNYFKMMWKLLKNKNLKLESKNQLKNKKKCKNFKEKPNQKLKK